MACVSTYGHGAGMALFPQLVPCHNLFIVPTSHGNGSTAKCNAPPLRIEIESKIIMMSTRFSRVDFEEED